MAFSPDDLQLGDHVCLVGESVDEYLDFLAAFTHSGLAAGHKVMVLAEVMTTAATRAWLEARVPTAEAAVASGALEIQPAREMYLRTGDFSADQVMSAFAETCDQAARDGFSGLWVSGDMSWALYDSVSAAHLMDYESAVNRLFLDRRIAGVCHYELRMFDPVVLSKVRTAHPLVAGGHALRFTRVGDPPGLRLTGTAGAANAEALEAVLASESHTAGPVTIDATGLVVTDGTPLRQFADLAAARHPHPTMLRAGPDTLARLHQLPTGPLIVHPAD
ncbi:hypothetical protein Sme01_34590 [Sphaerisporangium melleum]|uniref:MEDS domain-containing protein n=1 Tax=Sphaerisporangium melleum TaxID=321316 RepID=A0A917VG18_9ACTN|nr:MEDS domain-containing protein [Sphaerisporangium melleum]GGK74981.1 hypothetical protein GCM10007964_17270 [Sphaerisporangium melleum]GII70983.1 hypothetical protein Sme01_34590 [Sphaerisporangium melleum]